MTPPVQEIALVDEEHEAIIDLIAAGTPKGSARRCAGTPDSLREA